MTSKNFKKIHFPRVPDTPGVYFFKKGAKILYIGRATSLRDRTASYFKDDLIDTRGQFLVDMVVSANSLSWQETGSVLEAIILESNLIKKYQPKYNTKEKDDRSHNYVVITDEEFPRVMLVRGKLIDHISGKKYGPYPQGSLLREALVIIRKIFPFRDAKSGVIPGKSHSEKFYQSIGLSPDIPAVSGELQFEAKKEYAKTIRNLELFFEGRKKDLNRALIRDMKIYARARQFEKAEKVKRTLYALEHIVDVALVKKNSEAHSTMRIEAYDVAHLGGDSVVGVMTVIEHGEISKKDYRKFKLQNDFKKGNDDVGNLCEILRRRFTHPEWGMPDLIVVDGGSAQKNATEKIVQEMKGISEQLIQHISVVSVVKDEHHNPRDIIAVSPVEEKLSTEYRDLILLANAEAHRFAIAYHRQLRTIHAIKRQS